MNVYKYTSVACGNKSYSVAVKYSLSLMWTKFTFSTSSAECNTTVHG
jgi:hypothetical protein